MPYDPETFKNLYPFPNIPKIKEEIKGKILNGESIFQYDHATDQDSGELSEWFDEWSFDPEIIAECAYVHSDILESHLKENSCTAKIKKFKITVEELSGE